VPKRFSSETILDTERPVAARLVPPWWITVLDVLALVLVLLTIRALVGGGMRIVLGDGARLSFTSWPRLALWTAVLLGIRHALWRQLPWHSHVLAWVRATVRAEPVRAVFAPFAVSRALVSLVGFIAVISIGMEQPRQTPFLENDLLELWTLFDAAWYHGIASLGYGSGEHFNPAAQHPIAFFPGLPLAMRWVGRVLDIELWHAGIVVVLVSFYAGLAVMYRLAREDMTDDQARTAAMFLAFYPFATCYSAVLTEAPFLFVAASVFLLYRRDAPLWAAPLAFFAGLLRPNGFLLAAPLALLAIIPFARSRGWLPRDPGAPDVQRWQPVILKLLVAALPVAGMACYAAYVYSLTGDATAWMKAQQGWGRSSAGLLAFIDARMDLMRDYGWSAYPRAYPIEIIEAVAALFAIAAVWPITRRFGLAYGVFVALAVIPPFFTMGSVSLGRYTAPLFPIFLWLGATVATERRIYWIAVFAAGQALVATLFFTGRPPY
jgi:hypothetical protein